MDFIETYVEPAVRKLPAPLYQPPAGFVQCCGPAAMPFRKNVYQYTTNSTSWCGICGLTGQAMSNGKLWGTADIAANVRTIILMSRNNPPGAGGGYALHTSWRRPAGSYSVMRAKVVTHMGFSQSYADPNMQRYAPAVVAQPDTQTQAHGAGSFAAPPGGVQRVYSSGGGKGPPTLQAPRHRRAPPPPGTREGKVLTRTARLGVLMYKVLDEVSEGAEMVSAIYEALPDDVKKRWDRPGRPGDNFGQYGLEGADWKLQALYYNWHKVDSKQAVRNMIKNHLSDKLIGAYQRSLPRNVGNAHSHSEMEFAKWLDHFLSDELGL